MKNKLLYLTAWVVFCHLNMVYSQDPITKDKNVYQLKGRIIDADNKPIIFAHVVNPPRHNATITDSTGFFKIQVLLKDTIRITAIGFHTRYIGINEKTLSDTSLLMIKLEKRTYDLPTVNIYELRWQVFKSEFMEQKVEEDQTAKRISNWMANLVPSDELRMIFQAARGPGFTINYKTKAERSRQKVIKLEKKYALIAPKFNDRMITNLTGLKGKEIYYFLQYCNFTEEFLIRSTEYEIIEALIANWEDYQSKGLHLKNQKK